MSEQNLPNPKNTNKACMTKLRSNLIDSRLTNLTNLTKVKSPISTQLTTKSSNVNSNQNDPIRNSQKTSQKQKQQHTQKVKQKQLKTEQYKANSTKYQFYVDELNTSSQESFMNVSMQQQNKMFIERTIQEKFKNSRLQIQMLVQKSIGNKQQKEAQKIMKRKRLQFYCCDSVSIIPESVQSSKKSLSLTNKMPKNNNEDSKKYNKQIDNFSYKTQNYRQLSFKSKQMNDLSMSSFNQSPLMNSQNGRGQHHFQVDSPSFLDSFCQESHSEFNKNKQNRIKHPRDQKMSPNDIFSHMTFHPQVFHNKTQTTSKNNLTTQPQSQQIQHTIPHLDHRRRNKIFHNQNKYGLKLSRAIRHEKQRQKLQGQLGVDVFHIIFQEEELLRQCCT